jgi:DNA-binding NarL/FixJ family response regulator
MKHALISTNKLSDKQWMAVRHTLEVNHPGFFIGLSIASPNITPAEEKLLSLIKTGRTYPQIAEELGISVESVRTAKYRLKKKLLKTRKDNQGR